MLMHSPSSAWRIQPLPDPKLRIAEIFSSIQGEGIWVGTPSIFVRVSGCNLRCVWCDTPYASWNPEGPLMTVGEIVDAVLREGRAPSRPAENTRASITKEPLPPSPLSSPEAGEGAEFREGRTPPRPREPFALEGRAPSRQLEALTKQRPPVVTSYHGRLARGPAVPTERHPPWAAKAAPNHPQARKARSHPNSNGWASAR